MKATEPLGARPARLRLDPETGALHECRYRVSVAAGPDAGRSALLESQLVVGSHPGASLLLNDPAVSRQHLEITIKPDGVHLRDLGSTNGTFVNGLRIQELKLPPGQQVPVVVGRTQLRIAEEDARLPVPPARERFGRAISRNPAMQRIFGLLERVACCDSSVLLLGETGTGKDLLAEAVHASSLRRNGPFVIADCGTMNTSLIDSELFGHLAGSFTGAEAERAGAFELAHGGTLFLDEIGELPLEVQPKLLRVLERGMVKRLGADEYRSVDVRIVAATHRDLASEVRTGRFREDLYFRLAIISIAIPPLRERRDDIPLLVEHLVRQLGRPDFFPSPSLLEELARYHWPGNVREMRNVVERVLAGVEPDLEAAPSARGQAALGQLPFKDAKERVFESFTREYIGELFRRHHGNVSEMARAAGIARPHLHRLIKRYDLKEDGARAPERDRG